MEKKPVKLLYIEWKSYGEADMKSAFIAEGHQLVCLPLEAKKEETWFGRETEEKVRAALRHETPDAVFSMDYFPAVARGCQKELVRYISWVYDCPLQSLYSSTIIYPCNVVYVFDKELFRKFRNAGVTTMHYLPLAANTERLDAIGEEQLAKMPLDCDVSFVGALYLEDENWFDQMTPLLSDYARGYVDALMASQLKIQGYYFVQELLGPILNELYRIFKDEMLPEVLNTREYFYAQIMIARRITAIERFDLLNAIVENHHTLDLFTYAEGLGWPNTREHGQVDYDSEMPLVFKQSKINLNFTLRSIQSGIPLRAMDIMGCGGFLLSNFQADFLDYFVPGEDFVIYESREDLLRKIDYYLSHEEERMAIARNGHDRVASSHTYRHRVREMLDLDSF